MHLKKSIILMTISACVGLTSCTEETLPAGLVLDFKAAASGDSTGIEITEFKIGVMDVELETEEENALEAENREENLNELIEFSGSFKVDLIKGESAPEFGRAIVNQVAFNEIEIKLGAVLDGGKTLLLSYNFEGKKYEISTEISVLEIEVLQTRELFLKRNVLNKLIIRLKERDLIEGLNLSSVLRDKDGIYRISEETYPDIVNDLTELLKTSFEGGLDQDRDGKIDSVEPPDSGSGN